MEGGGLFGAELCVGHLAAVVFVKHHGDVCGVVPCTAKHDLLHLDAHLCGNSIPSLKIYLLGVEQHAVHIKNNSFHSDSSFSFSAYSALPRSSA